MNPKADHVLSHVFDEYDKRIAKHEHDKELAAAERCASESKFLELRELVIRPVMQDFGDVLTSRGHGFRIYTEASEKRGVPSGPYLSIDVLPSDVTFEYLERPPYLMFMLDSETVRVCSSTVVPTRGGKIGDDGALPIDEITATRVESFLTAFLAEIFKP